MLARPCSPGLGPRSYQTTSPQRNGAISSAEVVRESASTGALIPMAGMETIFGHPGGTTTVGALYLFFVFLPFAEGFLFLAFLEEVDPFLYFGLDEADAC